METKRTGVLKSFCNQASTFAVPPAGGMDRRLIPANAGAANLCFETRSGYTAGVSAKALSNMVKDSRGWHCTAISILLLLGCGCGQDETPIREPLKSTLNDSVTIMKLESSRFKNGDQLDAKFTAEGQDVSPPLSWSSVPADTKSLALICDDPDAPSPKHPASDPWVHWVIFNIPADRSELPEGVHRDREPADVPGARQGVNSWPTGNLGYRGPAPPPGSGPHRYFFKIYALDKALELKAGATKKQLLEAMSGHVLGEGQLMGTYQR